MEPLFGWIFLGYVMSYHAVNTIAFRVQKDFGLDSVMTTQQGFMIFRFKGEDDVYSVMEKRMRGWLKFLIQGCDSLGIIVSITSHAHKLVKYLHDSFVKRCGVEQINQLLSARITVISNCPMVKTLNIPSKRCFMFAFFIKMPFRDLSFLFTMPDVAVTDFI
ncbi:hypothetical protein NC651_028419 [Populus alba x Populus x berolinensis]|nr:hypothetical protein NC651_028419 [Populus alba x Populus x berolinensis]